MEQDFGKDLIVLVTGTGKVTKPALEATLEDFIFGPPAKPGEKEISRDVKILLLENADGPGINTLLSWGTPMGMEFKRIAGTDDRDALSNAIAELAAGVADGNEVVFAMLYNPESKYEQGNPAMTDLEIIGEAKNYEWLTTLNLSEGLVDAFEGYESVDDRIKREALEAEFDKEQRAKAPHPFKPSETDEERCHLCNNFNADMRHNGPAKKTTAKKATTPRKRAVTKPVEAEDKPLLDAPQKALVEASCACDGQTLLQVHVPKGEGVCHDLEQSPIVAGLDNLVAKAVEREAAKKVSKNELSGTIVMSREPKKTELPKDVALVAPEEVWQDVAQAIPASTTHFTVAKADIIKLNEGMQQMAKGFSEILDAYKSIVEGQ